MSLTPAENPESAVTACPLLLLASARLFNFSLTVVELVDIFQGL
jgi:hypothetical protein